MLFFFPDRCVPKRKFSNVPSLGHAPLLDVSYPLGQTALDRLGRTVL
jgi:hypothetical protein